MEQQQIVLVTRDGEYHVQELRAATSDDDDGGVAGTQLVHVEDHHQLQQQQHQLQQQHQQHQQQHQQHHGEAVIEHQQQQQQQQHHLEAAGVDSDGAVVISDDGCHHHEATLKDMHAETFDDIDLECEEEFLEASPAKLLDRARLASYPTPDPRQKRRMDREGNMMLAELVSLPTPVVLEKLRQLENLAQILSQQEMKELTRAEVLNIL